MTFPKLWHSGRINFNPRFHASHTRQLAGASRRRARIGFSPISPCTEIYIILWYAYLFFNPWQNFHYPVIVNWFMRKCAFGAIFDALSIRFDELRIAWAFLHMIEWTITKQTIHMIHIMARIILTISIFKITIWIFQIVLHKKRVIQTITLHIKTNLSNYLV